MNLSTESELATLIMISGGGANIQPLSVTENKKYNAADYGCDGFNPVDVNVPDRYDEGYKDGYKDGYERRIEEYQQLKAEILREISRLQLSQKSIIFDKYMNGLKWEQVAVRNHYTSRHCKNIRREAVECLVKYFGRNQTISNFKMEA